MHDVAISAPNGDKWREVFGINSDGIDPDSCERARARAQARAYSSRKIRESMRERASFPRALSPS